MRIYTFHMVPGATALGDAVAVKEGFSWLAFLFDILWVLYHRLWLWAARRRPINGSTIRS